MTEGRVTGFVLLPRRLVGRVSRKLPGFLQRRGDVDDPPVLLVEDEALAVGLVPQHPLQVGLRHVADVDHGVVQSRDLGHGAHQYPADHVARRELALVEVGSDHQAGADRHQLDAGGGVAFAVVLLDELPGLLLGEGLALGVGGEVGDLEVLRSGPVLFGEGGAVGGVSHADGSARAGQDDLLGHAGGDGRLHDGGRSLDGRLDQVVLVLGWRQRKGRGDVHDVIASLHGLRHRILVEEIGLHQLERFEELLTVGGLQRIDLLGVALAPDGSPDAEVPRLEERLAHL
mmetsp:Transcript_10326/g.25024  ORF Transcript_10326/g.25024 Transcript_10326/m.25024 type:complete len:287 (-) Transcript_10326:170-1030(-)